MNEQPKVDKEKYNEYIGGQMDARRKNEIYRNLMMYGVCAVSLETNEIVDPKELIEEMAMSMYDFMCAGGNTSTQVIPPTIKDESTREVAKWFSYFNKPIPPFVRCTI